MKGLYRGFCRNESGTDFIKLNNQLIWGEWVQGYYVCLNSDTHRIYSGYSETDCGNHYPDCCDVIPETVCEAIRGLTDRNGKQVFEGDKVKWCSIEGTIVFELHRFYVKGNILWDFGHDDKIEVIGTIFDEQFAEGV